MESLVTNPEALPSGGREGGVWFSSWYVVSIDAGHIAQSPQSGTRRSPASGWSLFCLFLLQIAFPFSRGSSQPRDRTQVSCILGGFFTSWATREALSQHLIALNPSFPRTLHVDLPPLSLWSHLSELTEGLPPGLQAAFCPKMKLNSTPLKLCIVSNQHFKRQFM